MPLLNDIDSRELDAAGPITVVLDSVDILMSNLASMSATQVFLSEVLATVTQRGSEYPSKSVSLTIY